MLHGTCRHVYGDDAEPVVFSFFTDISQSPAVIRAMLNANHTVQVQLKQPGTAVLVPWLQCCAKLQRRPHQNDPRS